jgi:phytoene desaturase
MSTPQHSIIGAGFSGLAAACCLAQKGHSVTVFEKHAIPGGRARQFKQQGYTFDMGPSWYWMPDVFEAFFNRFYKSSSDYYKLKRLDPSYRVIYDQNKYCDLPADMDGIRELFDSFDNGSAARLDVFLEEAGYKYKEAMDKFVWKPSLSPFEFVDPALLRSAIKLNLFKPLTKSTSRVTSHPVLSQILEFPVLFLGAKPKDTPGLYSMMNYADMNLGTWYPMGGMFEIVKAMYSLAKELGVKFRFNEEIRSFGVEKGKITALITDKEGVYTENVVASADYHFVDQELTPRKYRNYSGRYWEKRNMAPSCLLYYIGVNKEIPGLLHHNLFFDAPFDHHASQIYDDPAWPENPLFYVCAPSKTDKSVAPDGHENIFILIPIAPGLGHDTESRRMEYLNMVSARMERLTGINILEHLHYLKTFAVSDFISEYHAFKGNAYGLANTLMQTAFLKPRIKSKKIDNLYFTGQLSVPGPGVPPSLISGQIVADYISEKRMNSYA